MPPKNIERTQIMVLSKDEKANDANKLEVMRHSAAHVLAEAMRSIFPGAKFGIGPAIQDGFYYDFDLPRALTPDDLPVIETRMKEIIKKETHFPGFVILIL